MQKYGKHIFQKSYTKWQGNLLLSHEAWGSPCRKFTEGGSQNGREKIKFLFKSLDVSQELFLA